MSGPEYRQHLVDEANTSVQFANLLATLGTGITGFLLTVKDSPGIEVPIIYSLVVVFAALFASIFYANVTGMVRHTGEDDALVPMFYGNAITEYLCIYLFVIIFPLGVLAGTGNVLFGALALGVIGAMFLVYHISGFDLLRRSVRSGLLRTLIVLLFLALSAGNLWAAQYAALDARYGIAFSTMSLLTLLTILDIASLSQQRG